MALSKPAQKVKCVARNVPITGTEHSAAFRAQYAGRQQMFVDTKLALYRDDTNPHDQWAVQVRAKRANEDSKMGWIGMRTGHSEKIAKLMDALPDWHGSYVVITRREGALPPKFYGDVYLPDYDEPAKDPPLSGRRVTHLMSQKGKDTPIDLTPYVGQVLLLVTQPSRVSVTLSAANGDRIGWFRKSGLDDIDDWTVKRALVKGKSMIDLIDKSAIPTTSGVVSCEVQVGALMPNVRLRLTESEVRAHYQLGPYDELVFDSLQRTWNIRQSGRACWRVLTPEFNMAPDFRKYPLSRPKPETRSASSHSDEQDKRHAAEKLLRERLLIPKTLMLQTGDDQHIWLISEDGEHWLHLLDLPAGLKALPGALDVARRYAFEQFEQHYPADFYLRHEKQNETATETQTQTQPQKETTMSKIAQTATALITANKAAAATAGYMEAGRIANNQLAKLAGPRLPFMVRGYAETAFGKLVIANIAAVAVRQLRPEDVTLNDLTEAMTVQAFQEIYQQVDIEGILDSLLSSPEMVRATGKLAASKKAAAAKADD